MKRRQPRKEAMSSLNGIRAMVDSSDSEADARSAVSSGFHRPVLHSPVSAEGGVPRRMIGADKAATQVTLWRHTDEQATGSQSGSPPPGNEPHMGGRETGRVFA